MADSDNTYAERDEKARRKLSASALSDIRMLLPHPNAKEATKMVEGLTGKRFDEEYAGETAALNLERADRDERADYAKAHLKECEQQERSTASYEVVPEVRKTGSQNKIPFDKWDRKDQIFSPLALIALVLLLPAASFNVFAAVMSQGVSTFVQNPWLAVGLSILLPAGSLAVHSLGDYLPSDRARHRYMLGTLSATAVVLLVWIVLFSDIFIIGSGSLDFETLGQLANSSSTDRAFTLAHLLGELLVSVSLFVQLGHTLRRYTGETTIRKPEMAEVAREKKLREGLHDAARERCKQPQVRTAQIAAIRQCHVTEQKLRYEAFRRRFEETSPL